MLYRGRQLQHRGGLACDQPSDLHNPAVRKFKRIVMDMRIVHINLAKPRDPVIDMCLSEKAQGAVVSDVILKRKLCAGKEADSTSGSPIAVKPRVIDFAKSVVVSLSPTLAGREATR
jgi:hypothetical protein